MDLIRFLLKHSRFSVFLAVFFGILSAGAGVYLIGIVHLALDGGVEKDASLIFIFVVALAVLAAGSIGGQLPLFRISEDALFRMRLEMIRNIVGTRLRVLEEIGQPRLYAALTSDLNRISEGLVMLPMVIIQGLVLAGCILYLGILSWKVLLGTLAATLIMVTLFKFIMSRATGFYREARETEDSLFQHIKTVTEGNKELKLHAGRARQFFDKLLIPTIRAYRGFRLRGSTAFAISVTVSNLIFFLIIGFLVFLFPRMFEVTPEIVSGTVLIFVFIMSPLGRLLDMMPLLARAGIALKKVRALALAEDFGEEKQNPENISAISPSWRVLELKGVTHTYHGERDQFTLGPIDLIMRPGECLFLTGGNGSGKSTLAKLIAGLYEPEQGAVILDGVEIGSDNRPAYRQMFSAIFSDFFLFEHFLGLDEPDTLERARGYLEELQLQHKVHILEDRFSTTDLSSGQRKRLALLVSYLEDRPVYLFDEWASDQDPVFKEVFYKEILADLKKKGKATLVISHDDRYFHLADRIAKLESGKIV